ncbi:MAG TPA: hypothetical protein VFC23_17590 [Thermoanaerobaculia bacterium]|nr:hypothetical protein [Thermoanaerobaculia bacterium]
MRPSPHDALNRWLAAERDASLEAGDAADVADAALREVFAALPQLAPAAGFADRVLARAGLQPATRDVFASRALRLALVLSLIAVSFGALWVPPAVRVLARLWTLSDAVQLGVRALAEGSRGLATALRVGEWLFALGRALSVPLMTPQVMAALTAGLLVSGLAFRFLRDQLTGERSLSYVDPLG